MIVFAAVRYKMVKYITEDVFIFLFNVKFRTERYCIPPNTCM